MKTDVIYVFHLQLYSTISSAQHIVFIRKRVYILQDANYSRALYVFDSPQFPKIKQPYFFSLESGLFIIIIATFIYSFKGLLL